MYHQPPRRAARTASATTAKAQARPGDPAPDSAAPDNTTLLDATGPETTGPDATAPEAAPPRAAPAAHARPPRAASPAATPPDQSAREAPGTALVPVRHRGDGWTPARQRQFLEALADTGSVSAAAQAVGMSVQSAYRLRRRDDAAAFDIAWEGALERAMQQLVPVALDRAINGTLRQHFYHGELVGEERVLPERLLIWMMEKGSAMLGHARARRLLREEWERTLDTIEAGATHLPDPEARFDVMRLTDKHWTTNAPPPPGYKGNSSGLPGDKDYFRFLTPEEEKSWATARHRASPAQEATRRRFFGLD